MATYRKKVRWEPLGTSHGVWVHGQSSQMQYIINTTENWYTEVNTVSGVGVGGLLLLFGFARLSADEPPHTPNLIRTGSTCVR